MNSQKDPLKGGVCHFWHKANCLSGLVELDIITPVQPITRVWGWQYPCVTEIAHFICKMQKCIHEKQNLLLFS